VPFRRCVLDCKIEHMLITDRKDSPLPEPLQRYFSVPELAKHFHVSDDYIREEFRHEPGVLHKTEPGTKNHRRKRDILLIPYEAVERFRQKRSR
jgi:hypothetical protein